MVQEFEASVCVLQALQKNHRDVCESVTPLFDRVEQQWHHYCLLLDAVTLKRPEGRLLSVITAPPGFILQVWGLWVVFAPKQLVGYHHHQRPSRNPLLEFKPGGTSYVSIQRFELNLCAKLEYRIKHLRIKHFPSNESKRTKSSLPDKLALNITKKTRRSHWI